MEELIGVNVLTNYGQVEISHGHCYFFLPTLVVLTAYSLYSGGI